MTENREILIFAFGVFVKAVFHPEIPVKISVRLHSEATITVTIADTF